jgi:hypothetical protein
MEKANLPPPLVDPEVDLRDFVFMPLDVVRLRDSDLGVVCTDAEIRSALWLWCASWHQVPAASLPDDDRVLAHMAGFGRGDDALRRWSDVRDGALRGYVKCSDGRLYHSVIAEKAREAWVEKTEFRRRREEFRRRQSERARSRWQGGDSSNSESPASVAGRNDARDDTNGGAGRIDPRHADGNAGRHAKAALRDVMPMKGTGTGTEKGTGTGIKEEDSSSSPPSPTERKGRGPIEYPETFLRDFWAVYPRPTHKIEALKAWRKAVDLAGGGDTGRERIKRAAEAFSETSRGKDPQYLPYPASWLNAGAWDDPTPVASAAPRRPGYVPLGNGG